MSDSNSQILSSGKENVNVSEHSKGKLSCYLAQKASIRQRLSLSPLQDCSVLSPVTNLAFNMCELTTNGKTISPTVGNSRFVDGFTSHFTPKRRISWSSSSCDSTPLNRSQKSSKDDVANVSSSSDEVDCSFSLINRNKFKNKRSSFSLMDVLKQNNHDSSSNAVTTATSSLVTVVNFESSANGSPLLGFPEKCGGGGSFDKENISSMLDSSDENAILSPPPPSSKHVKSINRLVSEDESRDSQDSGFIESNAYFGASSATAKNWTSPSRAKCSYQSNRMPKSRTSDEDDDDDGFLDVFNFDDIGGASDGAVNFSSLSALISAPLSANGTKDDDDSREKVPAICRQNNTRKSTVRRCLSMKPEFLTRMDDVEGKDDGSSSHQRITSGSLKGIFKSPSAPRLINVSSLKTSVSFKRPDPPLRDTNNKSPAFKRRKSDTVATPSRMKQIDSIARIQRSHSETEATIKVALQRSCQFPDLIGDFSRSYILPLAASKNEDVKSIDPETLADLIRGSYDSAVDEFVIVDCRYPYEYNGGHIQGAKNIFAKEDLLMQLLPNDKSISSEDKNMVITRTRIVIFHCEFSSERAPNMCRFLRNRDRHLNKECYPRLYHPEVYVLSGGYKAFFHSHKDLCVPKQYKPMTHKDHEADLRHFRAKSKSWNGDATSSKNCRVAIRPGLKF